MKTQTFLIRCEYPNGDHIPTQEFVENIQEYFAANIMDGERGRLVVKPVYQPKEEGLAEEEEVGLVDDLSSRWVNEFNLPDGYIFKDENGNVINATKIVLEKKKKEYPKTYEECCKVLDWNHRDYDRVGYESDLLCKLQVLILCRDAYWKIAGEEMGLGKPWKPDFKKDFGKWSIECVRNKIEKGFRTSTNCILIFPTEKMRDAFKENFDPGIEICKELL